MATCTTALSGNILNDCNEAIGRGLMNTAWIIDKASVTSVTRAGNIISAMAGAVAHKCLVPGSMPFNGTNIAGDDAEVMPGYTKVARLWLGANSPKNAQHVDELCKNAHIVVIELQQKNAEAEQAFIVIGAEQGAYGKSAAWDAYGDNKGGWAVDMTEEEAQTAQVFFWAESVEATRAALGSMVSNE